MREKPYDLQDLYDALVIIGWYVRDDSYVLDCTNGVSLRDGVGLLLAGGANNVAKRLFADMKARSNNR